MSAELSELSYNIKHLLKILNQKGRTANPADMV